MALFGFVDSGGEGDGSDRSEGYGSDESDESDDGSEGDWQCEGKYKGGQVHSSLRCFPRFSPLTVCLSHGSALVCPRDLWENWSCFLSYQFSGILDTGIFSSYSFRA